jgi:uncharacterized protein YkwD
VTRLACALLALTALPALAVTATPAAAAPAPTTVEAEAAGAVAVVPDAAAYGRRAAVLAAGRSLTVRVSAPAAGSRLVLRLRTVNGAATPAAITVDGGRAAGLRVATWPWRDHVVGAGHVAGAHTVTVTNPVGRPTLVVDRVGFVPPAPPRAVAPAPVDDAYETRIVQLVNAHRAVARLPRLAVSPCADRYAEDWSATMARTSAFRHRPALRTLLTGCRAGAAGENIAAGPVSADQMMAMWMRSPGHRANILSPRFTHIGVAAVPTAGGRTYGTQNFLRLG